MSTPEALARGWVLYAKSLPFMVGAFRQGELRAAGRLTVEVWPLTFGRARLVLCWGLVLLDGW